MKGQRTCAGYSSEGGSKGVHPQLCARGHGVDFTACADGFSVSGFDTANKVFEEEIFIGDDVRQHDSATLLDTDFVNELHNLTVGGGVLIESGTRGHCGCIVESVRAFRSAGSGSRVGDSGGDRRVVAIARVCAVHWIVGAGGIVFSIGDHRSVDLEQIAADAMVGGGNEGDLIAILTFSLENVIESSTFDEMNEIAIIIGISFEISEHRSVVVGLGTSCFYEIVVGAGGEAPYEEKAKKEDALFDAMCHICDVFPS